MQALSDEDVAEALSRAFDEGAWFRVSDLLAYFQSAGRDMSYFDAIGALSRMVRNGKIEQDSSQLWFRARRRIR